MVQIFLPFLPLSRLFLFYILYTYDYIDSLTRALRVREYPSLEWGSIFFEMASSPNPWLEQRRHSLVDRMKRKWAKNTKKREAEDLWREIREGVRVPRFKDTLTLPNKIARVSSST